MRPIYKLFILILLSVTATIGCADLILNEFKLWKFCLFLQEWRFGRSSSSEVIDFGANRKRVCDFPLVRNSNIGPLLHHFGDMTAFMCSWPHLYSTLILGVFPLHQIANVGVSQHISLKLFGREIIFEEFQPMWARYRYLKCVTDRQTDAILSQYRAVHSITQEKEITISWIRTHDNYVGLHNYHKFWIK